MAENRPPVRCPHDGHPDHALTEHRHEVALALVVRHHHRERSATPVRRPRTSRVFKRAAPTQPTRPASRSRSETPPHDSGGRFIHPSIELVRHRTPSEASSLARGRRRVRGSVLHGHSRCRRYRDLQVLEIQASTGQLSMAIGFSPTPAIFCPHWWPRISPPSGSSDRVSPGASPLCRRSLARARSCPGRP